MAFGRGGGRSRLRAPELIPLRAPSLEPAHDSDLCLRQRGRVFAVLNHPNLHWSPKHSLLPQATKDPKHVAWGTAPPPAQSQGPEGGLHLRPAPRSPTAVRGLPFLLPSAQLFRDPGLATGRKLSLIRVPTALLGGPGTTWVYVCRGYFGSCAHSGPPGANHSTTGLEAEECTFQTSTPTATPQRRRPGWKPGGSGSAGLRPLLGALVHAGKGAPCDSHVPAHLLAGAMP